MMKKFTFLMPAIVALFASCSQEDTLQTTDEAPRPVTITASLPEVAAPAPAATRAVTATEDDDATRCLMQLVEDGIAQEVQTGTISNGSCSFTVTLNPTKDYQLMFWADNGGYAADVVHGLEKMTVKAPSANASPFGIAYAGTAKWGGSQLNPTIDVNLQHVVGKLTLRTTEAVTGGKNYSLKIPATCTAYDVLSGELLEPSADGTTYNYTVPASGVAKGGDLFSIYLLAESETQTLTLTNDGAESQIPNVPLAPNKHTILKGDVQNAGHVNVTFTATVVEQWNSEETQYIIPGDAVKITPENCSDISGDGNYVVSGKFNTTITITGNSPTIYLDNATILVSNDKAINITGGNPTIHVLGTKNSVSSSNQAGIFVAPGASITIDGNGWLMVSSSDYPAIGGQSCGNIVIKNVTIMSTTASTIDRNTSTPAIGALDETCGRIEISSADVTVNSFGNAPCIGAIGSVPEIVITDSKITAKRNSYDTCYADYIGCGGSPSGYQGGAIQCGTGSITNSTIEKGTNLIGVGYSDDGTVYYDAEGNATEQSR